MDDVEDATLEGNLTITPNIDLGIPEAGITWLHNNNVLSPDRDSRVEISEGGVLTVRDVQASDRGTYTVRATNGIGTDAEASVDVTIECEFNCMNCSHSFCLIVVYSFGAGRPYICVDHGRWTTSQMHCDWLSHSRSHD